jgi:putative peptidoglycan lipid II flippase
MIGTLLVSGPSVELPRLATLVAWASVVGSALQFFVQVPVVLAVAPGLRVSLFAGGDRVLVVLRNFVPALMSRGVVQISGYIDAMLASLLPTGAVTGITNAQLLYTLPVSLFGMSVAAAELPEMSSNLDGIRTRLQSGLGRIAFFIVPSAVAFVALGDVIAAALLQTGQFRYEDARLVWGILAGAAVGLLASTLGRLYASAFFALHDTRTPLRCAIARVASNLVLGYVFAIPLTRALGVPALWGAAGLTTASGLSAWIEMLMLRRRLHDRLGTTSLSMEYLGRLWIAAGSAAAASWIVKSLLPPLHPILIGVLVLTPFGVVYGAATLALQVPESVRLWERVWGPPSGGPS